MLRSIPFWCQCDAPLSHASTESLTVIPLVPIALLLPNELHHAQDFHTQNHRLRHQHKTFTMAPSPVTIDLTTEGRDRLTSLPAELIHLVCDFLLPSHRPDIALIDGVCETGRPNSHPLDCLAASCLRMHLEVNSWAQHRLRQHASITRYKDLKSTKLQSTRAFLRGKGGLLTWMEKHCVFCGKISARSAILMNGFRCCTKCDRQQWPDKITKTAAKTKYDVKDHQLLPHFYLFKQPDHLPRLRYGTYMSSNVPTTMFLEADVRRLADYVHGDWKQHMDEKHEAAERRKRVKESRTAESQAADRERAAQNTSFQVAVREGRSQEVAAKIMANLLDPSELYPTYNLTPRT